MLMVAPLAEETVEVVLKNNTVSKPFVEMTLNMCDHFSGGNAAFAINGDNYKTISNKGYSSSSENYQVEPDATAASYFLALPIASGGNCSLKGFKQAFTLCSDSFPDTFCRGNNLSYTRGEI